MLCWGVSLLSSLTTLLCVSFSVSLATSLTGGGVWGGVGTF